MKNKIIVTLAFIIPLVIYFVLITIYPDKTPIAIAQATEQNMPKVLVFSTPMCGECRKMAPIIEKAQENYLGKVHIVKLNAADSNSEIQKLTKKHSITVVPTIIYIDKNDNVIERTEGSMSYEEFSKYINKVL
jgi:thioredoxin 1